MKNLDDFEADLNKNGEENKIGELFEQTINLYSKKKGFSLLISLFIKIYKKENLCSSLLKKFREMNRNTKDNEKNMERKSNLNDYTSIFKEIIKEANNTPPLPTEKLTNITQLSTEKQAYTTLISIENPTNINTQESLISDNVEDNTKKNESNKNMSESESEILTQNEQMHKKQLDSKKKENET